MNSDSNEIIFLYDSESSLLNAAFDAVSGYGNLVPKHLKGDEIIRTFTSKPSKRICFVLARFEGDCYEHLRSIGASIYGSQVILHYVREHKSLPNLPHPLFSTALINAVVTVTSITGSLRQSIFDSVQMLHGRISRDLTDDVNVVITNKVGSKKYIVGASRNLHILLPDWIDEAWKYSAIQDPIDMLLPVHLEKFQVPIFLQLVVCVSGLSVDERKEVSDLVVKHGGRYSGAMKIGETTHLIVKHASGVKYSHAKKWKIQIVSIRWLVDSVNRGYALDEEDYRVVESEDNASTPTSKGVPCTMSFANISAISHINSTTGVDETRSYMDQADLLICNRKNQTSHVLADCVIMLSDCTKEESQTYSDIIKTMGGKLCVELHDQVSEALTHVVVGTNSNDVNLKTRENDIFYVYGSWLSHCEKSGKYMPESEYLVPQFSENGDENQDTLADNIIAPVVDDADLQLINQYFGNEGFAEVDEFDQNKLNNDPTVLIQTGLDIQELDDDDGNEKQSVDNVENGGIFSGIYFNIHNELEANEKFKVVQLIESAGGRVGLLNNRTRFVVTPFFVQNLNSVSHECELVTAAWISHCVYEGTLCTTDDIDREPAYRPIIKLSSVLPLSDCVISLSGFVGKDRDLLTLFAQSLGAIVQECFLRKAVPSRNLAASTHLIAAKPDGRKWPAAKQWGLPAVNRSWLYTCAKSWTLVDAVGFEVDSFDHNANCNSNAITQENQTCVKVGCTNEVRVFKEICTNKLDHQMSMDHHKLDDSALNKSLKLTNLTDFMHTPDWVRNSTTSDSVEKCTNRSSFGQIFKPSPPLSVKVSRCLDIAIEKTAVLPKRRLELSDDNLDVGCLQGVVICVAKHLSGRQVELNRIVKQLGGDFKWTYDAQMCTHIIAETLADHLNDDCRRSSMLSDNTFPYADVDAAKQDGKSIVNPQWLTSCLAALRRLPETEFLLCNGQQQVGTSCHEFTKSTIEPKAKVPRNGSSTLLGDVNRRLEMLMGAQLSSKHESTETGLEDANVSHPSFLSPIHDHHQSDADFDLDKMKAVGPAFQGGGQRRIRRNPRRLTVKNNVSDGSLNEPHTSACSTDVFQTDGCVEAGSDFAQPGQSLTVRWQYKDTVPRSITSESDVPTYESPADEASDNVDPSSKSASNQLEQKNASNNSKSSLYTSNNDINKASSTSKSISPKPVHMISFSGLPSDERDHYAAIVVRLGGEVDNQSTLSEKTTHLIVHTPTRSEKCLICLATGKWMLHKSYLDACQRDSRWIDEAPYEWGGPGTEPLLIQLSPAPLASRSASAEQQRQQAVQIRDLARSARRWRLAGGSAFDNWSVIFGPGCDKESSFRRVIEAGSGKVLASSPPYPPPDEVTHAFYKIRANASTNSTLSLPRLYNWLRIDYLCAYLTAGQEVAREQYAL